MQLALRQAYGMGDAYDYGGEYTYVSNDPIPTDTTPGYSDITFENPTGAPDPSTLYPAPGYNITTAPGPDLTAAELAAEQARATAWLNQIPGVISMAGKVALTAAQISAGVAAGAIKASSTCPGGYLVAGSGQCVVSPVAGQLISGVSNQTTLAIAGIALVVLIMLGGRRR